MKYTVITPTGDRQVPLSFCRNFLESQTVKPDLWLVVDDGKESAEPLLRDCTIPVRYIRRTKGDREPAHTLGLNLMAGLQAADRDDYVIMMEDDDWYSPRYLETMMRYLDMRTQVVGLGPSIYYRLDRQEYRVMKAPGRSSMYMTGFGPDVRRLVLDICRREPMCVDLALWQSHRGPTVVADNPDEIVALGVKGLPGRPGLSSGWRQDYSDGYIQDTNIRFLTQTVGIDALRYYTCFLPPQCALPLINPKVDNKLITVI